jgi:hypothetical protein
LTIIIGGGVTLVASYFRGCINIYNKKDSFKQYPLGSTLTHVVIFFVFTQDLEVKNVPPGSHHVDHMYFILWENYLFSVTTDV